MSKPQVCIFCRYRKTRAADREACCAAAELSRSKASPAESVAPARTGPSQPRFQAAARYQPR